MIPNRQIKPRGEIHMHQKKRSFFKLAWPLVLLVALVVLFFSDLCFGDRFLWVRDLSTGDLPIRSIMAGFLRHGQIQFWCSNFECGVPALAQPGWSGFYPPNWIFMWPHAETALLLWWIFHLSVGAISFYLLCRHWKMQVASALVAAISFIFSTYVATWLEFAHGLSCFVWGPLALLLVSLIIDRSKAPESRAGIARSALQTFYSNGGVIAGLAVVTALQILSSGEFFYYFCLLGGSYTLFRWYGLRSKRVLWLSTAQLAMGGILGAMLALPQLGLTLQLMKASTRVGEVDPLTSICSASPLHWLTFVLPFLYGGMGYPNHYWAPKIYELALGSCYVGIVTLFSILFLLPLLGSKNPDRSRRSLILFVGMVGIAGLIMAAGQFTPVYTFLHHYLPGLGHLRFATKFYLFVTYAFAILGGFGFDALIQRDSSGEPLKRMWKVGVGLFGVLAAGYVIGLIHPDFITWLSSDPAPSAVHRAGVLSDYTLAILFLGTGLTLFGLFLYQRITRKWLEVFTIGIVFANLWIVSRQTQPVVPAGIHEKGPEEILKTIGGSGLHRVWSSYSSIQQWLYGETRPEMIQWAREAFAVGDWACHGGYGVSPGAMVLERYANFYSFIGQASPAIREKIADMLSVRFIVSGAPFDQVLWGGASREIKIDERPNYIQRASLVTQWQAVTGGDNAIRRILSEEFDPHKEAVVEADPSVVLPKPEAGDFVFTKSGYIESFHDNQNSVTLDASVYRRSLLVLGDSWFSGWTVKVDGEVRPIYRTNYAFRGVFLDSGKHHIEFSYIPDHFLKWLALFGVGCSICVFLSAKAWIISRAKSSR